MGRKVFVSYKYSDSNVYPLARVKPFQFAGHTINLETTARHYVDELQSLLSLDDHINKGENDDESLAAFKDSTIESKLRAKIYDSSITLVMISPNMKEIYTPESDQWIPWEISYSLRTRTRNGRTSQPNAVMAVVLPDAGNSFSYFMTSKNCCTAGCTNYQTGTLFQILRDNMFNRKSPAFMNCSFSSTVHSGEFSYIPAIGWYDCIRDVNGYLDRAIRIRDTINDYSIIKTVA